MGGLLVLALIGGYIWGASKLFKHVQPHWKKALVVIAAILLPTADAVYGRIKLKQMCEAEGGLHIYRVVDGVEGFGDPKSRPTEGWVTKYGYRFVEGREANGKNSRLTLKPDGMVYREVGVAPMSEFEYDMRLGGLDDIYLRIEQVVRVRNTGEVLGRSVNISYAGGWFERFVSGLYAARGTAGTCGPSVSNTELITKTLKPISQEISK